MTDLEAFRGEFPALERVVWLNTPTAPPGARPVLAELRRVQDEWERGEFSWRAWEAEAYATRGRFARLLGAEEDQVALMSSISEAAATVAASLPPGRVVVGAREFRSNLFPWLALRDRGFEVVEVPAEDGVVRGEALAEHTTPGTVLVAVSEVQSSNGFRVHLAGLAERAREVGARLFVDACQSAGALRVDLAAADPDFVAAHGYKWLLGPRGAAWLYVRPDRLDELAPLVPSWKSPEDPYADYYGGPLEYAKGARRLDTSLAWFSWPGARAALDLILSLDPADVEARCLGLAGAFREGAEARGFRLVPEEVPSHVVGLVLPDPERVGRALRERRVVAAVRGGFLRLGFHAFNDEGDVEAALAALGDP